MKRIIPVAMALTVLIGCTKGEPSKVNSSTNEIAGLDKRFIPDIEERLHICTSQGEHLVRVPDQIGGDQNYFACAENSWDCVPITVYERTGKGYGMAYLIDEDGYVIVDHGRQTNWDGRRDNQHKCIPPRRHYHFP